MLKQSAKQLARRDKFKKLGQAISQFVSDPSVGLCKPHPWRVRNSGGYQVMQIVTDPGQSKLEKRSLEYAEPEPTS